MKLRPNQRRDEEIIARYEKGATLRALGVLYGISDNRVHQILKRAGIQTRGRGQHMKRVGA